MPGLESQSVPDGYMRDSTGRLVPLSLVKPEHLLEDALVRELDERARRMARELEALKAEAFAEIGALLELLASKHGVDKGGMRGNLTLNSFDGSIRVQVAIGDQVAFGPELQVAKTLLDNCLRRRTEGGDPLIQTLVMDAFDVGKEGKVKVDRVLALRRHSVDDDEWKRAMEAISEAVRVVQSRRYIRFYRRPAPDKAYEQVPLDIARVPG